MVTKKQLVQITESAIDHLVTTFKKGSYSFYTENDLHCYLYTQLLNSLSREERLCKTADGRDSILLHKEYPTKERYSRKALKEGLEKGARGHFDLSIWNPEKTEERLFRVRRSTDFWREQQTFIVIEFDLIEGNDNLDQAVHHFKWDLMKLKGERNEVEYGYQLIFVRDWTHSESFLEEVKPLVSGEKSVVILYIENTQQRTAVGTLSGKHFLNYNSFV
ncbi:MAG: hypothetical protein O2V44_02525 [Candidatus Bathyarchaeota archaeon]|nr:hypothetical protein [Candidatus Bathyarchaeota archaeon]